MSARPAHAVSIETGTLALSDGMRARHATARDLRDPFIWRAAALLSLSTAALVLGLYSWMFLPLGGAKILDSRDLFFLVGLPVGIGMTILFVILVLFALGRSSRAHLVLVEGVLVGGLGFVLFGYATACYANVVRDQSPSSAVDLRDIQITKSCRRRGCDYDVPQAGVRL